MSCDYAIGIIPAALTSPTVVSGELEALSGAVRDGGVLQYLFDPMKLLSWNIQHGGGSRISRIIAAVISHDPDVIALSEFRTKPGLVLSAELRSKGWPHVESTAPAGSDNGLAVFSRTPLRRTRLNPAPSENAVRWLDIDLPEYGFGFGLLHILCSVPKVKDGVPGEAKTRFWNAVLGSAEERRAEPFLFLGDFNTGAHRIDEKGKTFVCAGHFGRLPQVGWTDVWRAHNPGETEWTWFSKLKGGAPGNGFRLDHAFATAALCRRVENCRYSHRERESGVSDHSILLIEVI